MRKKILYNIIHSPVITQQYYIFQYSGWEKKEVDDKYSNQKQLSDVVADYFFVCPTNLFANIVSSRGARVYYYFFTHVSLVFNFINRSKIFLGIILGTSINIIFL